MEQTIIMDGEELAKQVREELRVKVSQIVGKRVPGLVVVLVGQDAASEIYVNKKELACEEIGFYSEKHVLDEGVSEEELLKLVEQLNNDDKIDGILVQLPLPKHIDKNKIIKAINPKKDVDGFHPESFGKLLMGVSGFVACTPLGIMKLFEKYGIDLKGKNAVVIGRSLIVGKPMAQLLINVSATVTVCNRSTKDVSEHTKRADIIVVAAGQKQMIKKEMVKKGCVIIDVGTHRLENGKVVGDADYEDLIGTAGWITPVPGGVGPMTVVMLMGNTFLAWQNKNL